MNFGILGPYMSGTNRDRLLEWFRRVDAGPFRSIATGERVGWPQIEQQAFLAAAAAATNRVRILSTVMVLPMHAPVLLAKRLASIDVISGGRLVVGVGAGGRPEDYLAAERSFEHRWQQIDDAVTTMRKVWAGDAVLNEADVIGPAPVQPGGPPIYTGASGSVSLARAAKWADGWVTAMMDVELEPMRQAVQSHLHAWDVAGRSDRPYMINNMWFCLGDDAQARLTEAAAQYFGVPPASFARPPLHNVAAIQRAIDDCETAGFDEMIFLPIDDDITQLDRLEAVLSRR